MGCGSSTTAVTHTNTSDSAANEQTYVEPEINNSGSAQAASHNTNINTSDSAANEQDDLTGFVKVLQWKH